MGGYIGTRVVGVVADSSNISGNITVGGNVDGRDVSVDGTKLDTIPVISTSSVPSFTAKSDGTTDGHIQLNCSANTHGIKLKSPPHSASASYTLVFPTTAGNSGQFLKTDGSGNLSWGTDATLDNTKLPLAGGAMTGAITTNSTFDGRNVSSDGTKLDGIETAATADQTNAEIKTAVEAATNIALGGSPTTTTQAESDDSTKVATTAYVTDKITTLIGGAPSTLNDLSELAAAINNDANYNSTLTTALATKMPKAGGAFTGAVTTNSTFDGVDIATRDAVLTTTTNTANAALPKAGGAMTDDITFAAGGEVKFGNSGEMGLFSSSGTSQIRINSGTFKIRAADMRFTAQNGTTEFMRIDSNGIVSLTNSLAIGTTNSSGEALNIVDGGHTGQGAANTRSIVSLAENVSGNGSGIWLGSMTNQNTAVIGSRTGSGNIAFQTYSGGWGERVRITSNGKVGIGTASPSALLHLKSTAANASPTIILENTNNSQTMNIDYWNNGGAVQSRISYLEGPAAWSFIPNTSTGNSALYIKYSGEIGIGITAPAQLLHVQAGSTGNGGIRVGGGAGLDITHNNAGATTQRIDSLYRTTNNSANLQIRTGTLTFHTGASNTERMRVESGGNLLLGTQAAFYAGFQNILFNGTTHNAIVMKTTRAATGSQYAVFLNSAGAVAGNIGQTGTTTVNFNTSSDYRLKTDVQPMTGATDRVKLLKPCNFEWITDGTRVDGFLAHEAQAVVPEAVTGTKDAMRDEEYEVTAAVEEVTDDDGNVTTEAADAVMGTRSVPDMQGIDQSKLVPLLVKTIQELEARITALEA